MASTLVAGDYFGSGAGYVPPFAGSLTPATLAGVNCLALYTLNSNPGVVTGVFEGDQRTALNQPLTVDGAQYSIYDTSTYNGDNNQTTIRWSGFTAFTIGSSYTVSIGEAGPPFGGPMLGQVGTFAAGTANITPALPAYSVGDRLFLAVESANQAVAAPAGWTEVGSSPQGTGTAAGTTATRLSLFTKVAGSGEGAPTVLDPGDHAAAFVFAVGPCDIHAVSGAVAASASTTASFPALATTVDNCLILAIVSVATDVGTARASAWNNGFTERADAATTQGNGGGIAIASKEKTAAGAVGATQATLATSSVQGLMMIALMNPAAEKVYVGATDWAERYKGLRSDGQLYVGAKILR